MLTKNEKELCVFTKYCDLSEGCNDSPHLFLQVDRCPSPPGRPYQPKQSGNGSKIIGDEEMKIPHQF
jgi:hypothetical protein